MKNDLNHLSKAIRVETKDARAELTIISHAQTTCLGAGRAVCEQQYITKKASGKDRPIGLWLFWLNPALQYLFGLFTGII